MNSTPPAIPVSPAPLMQDLLNLAEKLKRDDAVKIAALGSSSTAGEGNIVPYPHRLEMMLRQSYSQRDGRPYHMIDVLNRGIGGEEAPKERDRLKRDVIDEKPCLVIWQVGTNAVWQSAADHPPSQEETIAKLRSGIEELKQIRTIDIILMDLQYTPAVLTPPTVEAAKEMVRAIAGVAQDMEVNLFRRFELMEGWHNLAGISFDQIVDPNDTSRLHQSDWATQQISQALHDVIFDAVKRAAAGTAQPTAAL
jgi:hypothetical protein